MFFFIIHSVSLLATNQPSSVPPLREMCFAICGCHGEEMTEESGLNYSVFLVLPHQKRVPKDESFCKGSVNVTLSDHLQYCCFVRAFSAHVGGEGFAHTPDGSSLVGLLWARGGV